MTVLFKVKTQEGYALKVLAELLQHNIKTACFEIDKSGISLCTMDHHRIILINLKLHSDRFCIYKFKNSEKMIIGVNPTHLHKMLKMIKKKDSVQLFIDDKNPTDLGIKVIPKENSRVTTSFVKIQEYQNIDIDIPEGYSKPVIVSSPEFQKMSKDLVNISTIVTVVSKGFHIRFKCDGSGVMRRQVDFGETDDSEDSDDDSSEEETEYVQDFNTAQLTRITKLAGLSSNMQIFPKEGLPLLFRSDIGSLGSISIYIKSLGDVATESRDIEDSDND